MRVRKLLVIAAICGSASGCQTFLETSSPFDGEEVMEVRGVVKVFTGGHGGGGLGLIKADDGRCYDLALPKEVVRNRRRWNQRAVVLSGELQFRPVLSMPEMMWFEIGDRRVDGFGCSEDIIYVRSIRRVKG
ncbi:hypothetical protein [Stenotrophomonas sp.]|uniref:hypothetical protein n=1 Tax=Stenotrophomonas sp. TaxID=69392 RepID=UPI0028A968FC|nr:hypothetical protein [Stenotrophomonas sp.]